MKSKLSWIPFVLLLPAACFFKLAQSLFPEGVLGLNALRLDYVYMGAAALMFLFAALFCGIDKKIAAYYLPHRNIAAGLMGLALALVLAADGAGVLMRVFSSGEQDTLTIIGAVLSLICAIVFIVMGLNHMIRNTDRRRFSLLYALPAILMAVRMIVCFVSFTTVSIRLADVSKLICYMFASMFFFYYAILLSLTKTKNAVKYCYIFGLPAIVALVPYGVYHLMFSFNSEMILNNAETLEMLILGLYIFTFLIELSIFVGDKDSVVIDLGETTAVDHTDEKVEGFLANNIAEDQNDVRIDNTYIESSDTEGFLYQETENPNDEADRMIAAESEVDAYLTEVMEENSPENPEDNRPKNYEDQLDDIDKLILEISEQSD